jgi:integrase
VASVIQRPSGKWLVQVKREGVFCSKHFINKTDAVKWGRAKEVAIESGKLTKEIVNMPTLYDALTRYKNEVSSKKHSKRSEEYRIKRIQKEDFAQLKLDKITSTDIKNFRDERLKEVGDQTVRHDLNLIDHCYTIANNEWTIKVESPVKTVKKPAIPEGRQRELSPSEMIRFLDTLNKCERHQKNGTRAMAHAFLNVRAYREFQLFIKWQLRTAMRKNESLSLTWQNVNLETSIAFLPKTKNGRKRKVALDVEAVAILQQLRVNTFGKVFPLLTSRMIDYYWKKLLMKALIANYHIHDLRHEAITRMMNDGVLLPQQVMTITGHTNMEMLMRYYVKNAEKIAELMRAKSTSQTSAVMAS